MRYQEYLPHPQLQRYVDAYWTICIDETAMPVADRILPDGCVDLIMSMGTAVPVISNGALLKTGRTYLVGTMTRFSLSLPLPGARLLGIRFKPACFAAFFPLSLEACTDRILPFKLSLDADFHELYGEAMVQALDQCLLQRLIGIKHTLLPVIEEIYGYKGQITVNRLAAKHFIGNRQLERSFKQYTGVSPKAFANLVRYLFALERIKARQDNSLLEIAFDTGYYDHAHLTNEIKKYTGLQPSQF